MKNKFAVGLILTAFVCQSAFSSLQADSANIPVLIESRSLIPIDTSSERDAYETCENKCGTCDQYCNNNEQPFMCQQCEIKVGICWNKC